MDMGVAQDKDNIAKYAHPAEHKKEIQNIIDTFEDMRDGYKNDFTNIQKKVKQLLLKARG